MPSKAATFAKIEEAFRRSKRRSALWHLLKAGNPVPIVVLFNAAPPKKTTATQIRMQQYVGSYLSTMNKVLALYDLRITPGDPRATYQLRPLYS